MSWIAKRKIMNRGYTLHKPDGVWRNWKAYVYVFGIRTFVGKYWSEREAVAAQSETCTAVRNCVHLIKTE